MSIPDKIFFLREQMAISAIADDFVDIFIPREIAIKKAQFLLASQNQKSLEVKHRMGQALLALDFLGYDIIKR
jgi:hypothetical protein